mgnify:FL=1
MDCHVSNKAGVILELRDDKLQFLTTFDPKIGNRFRRTDCPLAPPFIRRISTENYAVINNETCRSCKNAAITSSDPRHTCKKLESPTI